MSLLDVLRHQTRNHHEALHRHPLLSCLSGESLTLTDFHHVLLAFDAYYTYAEAACVALWPEDAPNAPVLAWLESDLAQHGLDSWADRIKVTHPPLDTPSKLAGYLYTKQGSTLGGNVISKHIERQLGLIPHIDQWFFAGYHHDNGQEWKRFAAVLDGSGFDADEAVATARHAFEAIARCCDQVHRMRIQPELEGSHEA